MRQTTMFLAALTLVLAAPAAGQETILGFLEPPVIDGCRPNASNCVRQPGVIRVFGWALADSGVRKVTIQVDGIDIGQASHGAFRPLVADLHPGFPDSQGAGFGYHLNGTDFQNGLHDITAKVETFGGTTVILPAVRDDGTILSDGVHKLTSDKPVGVISYGYDDDVSYGYTAGLNLSDQSQQYRELSIRPSTDDWPYLYMDPQNFPWVLVSCVVLNVILVLIALTRLSRDHWPAHGDRATGTGERG